jgi:hypothetical protein
MKENIGIAMYHVHRLEEINYVKLVLHKFFYRYNAITKIPTELLKFST